MRIGVNRKIKRLNPILGPFSSYLEIDFGPANTRIYMIGPQNSYSDVTFPIIMSPVLKHVKRPALGIDVALEGISKNKGVFYGPDVVDTLLRLKTSEIEVILG